MTIPEYNQTTADGVRIVGAKTLRAGIDQFQKQLHERACADCPHPLSRHGAGPELTCLDCPCAGWVAIRSERLRAIEDVQRALTEARAEPIPPWMDDPPEAIALTVAKAWWEGFDAAQAIVRGVRDRG